ncbi:MAG: MaoC family dehydratase [Halobacteriaceae archaeon]
MPVAAVGATARTERTVTREMIDRYAAVVGDENPLHLDQDYAQEGLFGGIVAHGMLGAGLISAALADLPGDIVYVNQDLAFEAPVRPGDQVTATVEVEEQLGDDRLRVSTVAVTDETRVIDGEAVVLSVPHEQ